MRINGQAFKEERRKHQKRIWNQENRNAGKSSRKSGIQEARKQAAEMFLSRGVRGFQIGFLIPVSFFPAFLIDQSGFGDSSTTCTIKLFFSAIAGIVAVAAVAVVGLSAVALAKADDPGSSAVTDAIVARNSCSRFDGTSTRMLIRRRS